MTLQSIWFVLVFILLIGYAILDGYDLGVGVLHLLGRDERERRISLNAIGPIWDGNEVWLLTAGGALFAAFPPVYATVFSGFYIALMLLLVALIGRAVALEFRSKVDSPQWKRVWDITFFLGSLLPAVLLGVAFGNILRGVPIDSSGDFAGSFLGLLNPYSVLVGVLALVACTLHGALFLAAKSQGAMRDRLAKLVTPLWATFVTLYVLATILSYVTSPFLFEHSLKSPIGWLLLAIVLAATVAILVFARAGNFARAVVASSAAIGGAIGLAGLSLFPRLVPSFGNLSRSLTITNSSSTPPTLKAMLIIALIGMPLVLIYTVVVHRVFKGAVVLDEESYY